MPGNPVAWRCSVDQGADPTVPLSGMRHFWLDPIPVYARAESDATILPGSASAS
jgi:hypothetical protein